VLEERIIDQCLIVPAAGFVYLFAEPIPVVTNSLRLK
jgi:hypothetical protein